MMGDGIFYLEVYCLLSNAGRAPHREKPDSAKKTKKYFGNEKTSHDPSRTATKPQQNVLSPLIPVYSHFLFAGRRGAGDVADNKRNPHTHTPERIVNVQEHGPKLR